MWDYNIFGRSLKELITDDLNSKLMRMPEDTQYKFKETLQKIINEGNGGLICIMLQYKIVEKYTILIVIVKYI